MSCVGKIIFAQPIVRVICKMKPFKTNNLSEVLYGLHISNAPTMGVERCDEHFGKSCTSIHVIHNCANIILLSKRALFGAFLWGGGSLHSAISIGSIIRGENVMNANEKL